MSFLADQELVGRILSFAGLFLAPFCSLFARHYSRSLYFMQFLYIVNMLFKPSTTTTMTISSYLNYSFLDFIPEITSGFCMTGDFACTYGKLVTAAIVWLAAAVFFFLLIKIVACKKRNAKFLSFYNWFKGIMYWFYGPLVYAAVSVLIPFVEASSFSSNNFYASAIVVIAFLGIALVELIAYKVAQREEENIWKKWI